MHMGSVFCKPGSRLGNWLQSLQDLAERGLQLPTSCPLDQGQDFWDLHTELAKHGMAWHGILR